MPDLLTKLAYQTFQESKKYFGLTHKTVSTQLMNWVSPVDTDTVPVSPDLLLDLQRRFGILMEKDWQDAEDGVYPVSVLFDNPWEDFFRYYPTLWADLPTIWNRAREKQHQEFGEEIDTTGYPTYYVQNFHHQTDGYLSDRSASLYDLQVEILFNGSADAMRRRILAPLKRGVNAMLTAHAGSRGERFAPLDETASGPKVLDIACGTGRTLRLIRAMMPQASLHGVDLSPAYLRKANQLLSQTAGTLPQLVQANAEVLPYRDNYFDATTSVFLFHELPAAVRQTVINEAYRVTKPGGTFVIADSIQRLESPELEPLMDNFVAMFHEPYYRHYTTDDLGVRLAEAGFVDVTTEVHFMSKYWTARKPV